MASSPVLKTVCSVKGLRSSTLLPTAMISDNYPPGNSAPEFYCAKKDGAICECSSCVEDSMEEAICILQGAEQGGQEGYKRAIEEISLLIRASANPRTKILHDWNGEIRLKDMKSAFLQPECLPDGVPNEYPYG